MAKRPRKRVRLLRVVRFENHLGKPFAIPQIDEHGAAMVPAILNPPKENHRLADVLPGELSTIMGALELGDEFHCHLG